MVICPTVDVNMGCDQCSDHSERAHGFTHFRLEQDSTCEAVVSLQQHSQDVQRRRQAARGRALSSRSSSSAPSLQQCLLPRRSGQIRLDRRLSSRACVMVVNAVIKFLWRRASSGQKCLCWSWPSAHSIDSIAGSNNAAGAVRPIFSATLEVIHHLGHPERLCEVSLALWMHVCVLSSGIAWDGHACSS